MAFWALIAECRVESANDTELTARVLFRRLRTLDATNVAEFVQHWERARSRLFSWSVADAACLLFGRLDEEDLRPIQDWIISFGRDVVMRVAQNPDNLVDLADDRRNARATWFDEFTTEAHIVGSGTWPIGYDPNGPDELTGEHLPLGDTDVVARHYPRLAAFRRDHPEIGDPLLR
jgi:hypothetical protein